MNPLLSAEQAVLGAVLLDPDQLSHLDWLAPDHFYRPVHQALFDALRKLRSNGHPALSADGPVPLSWVTDAVDEAGLHVRGLTAAYAHTLVQACPRTEHAPVYGRMVLEGGDPPHHRPARDPSPPGGSGRRRPGRGRGSAAYGGRPERSAHRSCAPLGHRPPSGRARWCAHCRLGCPAAGPGRSGRRG